MADNRDPRKKSRTNRNRLTSSSNRTARSRGSAADTPRPTSSATRSSRTSGRAVVTQSGARGQRRGAQGPRNPPVQGPSRRTPNAIGGNTGRQAPPAPKGYPKPPKASGARAVTRAAGAARAGGILGRIAKPLAGAAALWTLTEGVMTRRAGDGTLKGKPSRPNNQKPKPKTKPAPKTTPKTKTAPKRSTGLSAGAKSFDSAFAAARKSGKSAFTWRGKKYNTKYKGE